MSTVETYGDYRITVDIDTDPDSPRSWDNFGTMVCLHNRYTLGDTPQDITKGDFNSWDEVREEIVRRGGVLIFPLGLYDHGGISMYIGNSHDRWDGGQVGFIYCTEEDMKREGIDINKAEEILRNEVKTYNEYLTGNVYQFKIEQRVNVCSCGECQSWEVIESCGGFYGEDEEALKAAKEWLPTGVLEEAK